MGQCLNPIAYHESILTLWTSRTEWNALFPGLDISQARSKYGGNVSCCFILPLEMPHDWKTLSLLLGLVTSLLCDSTLRIDNSKERMIRRGCFLSAAGLSCHRSPKSVHSTLTPVGQLPAPFPHAAGLHSAGHTAFFHQSCRSALFTQHSG